jgi:hypothetical protein
MRAVNIHNANNHMKIQDTFRSDGADVSVINDFNRKEESKVHHGFNLGEMLRKRF